MSAVRLMPLLAAALCLGACARTPSTDALGRYAAEPAGASDRPLASLPASAGRILALRRTAFANGISQEIVLVGPRVMAGENVILIGMLTTARTVNRGKELKLAPPSDEQIAAEMEARLPGVTMSIAPAAGQNTLGPFGYATGSTGRLACIYVWQYRTPPNLSLFEGATDSGKLPISVRVRLCDARPIASLVDDIRGLAVVRPEVLDGETMPRIGGDDALTAALAAPRGSAIVADADGFVGDEATVATSERALRPHQHTRTPHRHRNHLAARRRSPRTDRDAQSPASGTEFGAAGTSRLPMPSDVAPAAIPAPQPASTSASADLPLPR